MDGKAYMANLYISPNGAGNQSGSNWANAARITSLDALVDKADPGGQVLIRADQGSYTVTGQIAIHSGGTLGHPVVIRGVDGAGHDMQATILGNRPATYAGDPDAGNELFKLLSGADNLKFAHLMVKNTGTVLRAGADIGHITIDDVDAVNVGRFFENYKSGDAKSATIDMLTIRNVDVTGFSNGAIRLAYDTHGVKIENVHADAAGQVGDSWIAGVHLDGTVHDVLIRNTGMANARAVGDSDDYWNGDGFATERGVYDVRFENTTATGNTDGGYDLKSSDTTLVHALAEGNGKNYRFWSDAQLIDSVGLNPDARGGIGKQNQIWIDDTAHVRVSDSIFKDSSGKTAVFAGNGGSISFDDVDVTHAVGTKLTDFRGTQIDGLAEITDHFVYVGTSFSHYQ